MRKLQELQSVKAKFLQKYSQVVGELSFFAKQCLTKKKILIISEKSIVSLPVSSKFQASVVAAVLTMMLWVSYSTGKYFAYENIISEKDHEIWSTNVNNENLQYQVTDLHQNLMELNKYFENIRSYDQLAQKKVFDDGKDNQASVDENGEQLARLPANKQAGGPDIKAPQTPSSAAQEILFNIRGKVLERISSLEAIIEMTGLKLSQLVDDGGAMQKAMEAGVSRGGQGGPYIPVDKGLFDKTAFDSEVSYLLQLEGAIHSLPLASPMRRHSVSSRFGVRQDPIHGHMALHSGVDLISDYHSKVYSSAPGVITNAEWFGAYGQLVEIDHGAGVTSRYGHLDKILVRKGQRVSRGQLIGLQGNSGRSTGPHLHYEVRYDNQPLDPEKFLKAGKYVF